MLDKYSPAEIESKHYQNWESQGYFRRYGFDQTVFFHPTAAAQRNRHAAHGSCLQPNHHGRPDPLLPHERLQHRLDSRYRPRGHRHANRGRASACRAKRVPSRLGARKILGKSVGVERSFRRHDYPANAPRGLLRRLDARVFHDGRRTRRNRDRSVRAPV